MKIFLAFLAYIITFTILALTGITIEALGAWLFGWHTGGPLFGVFAVIGAIAGFLAFLIVMGARSR